jgi:hypothetical protein
MTQTPTQHDLKIWPIFFKQVIDDVKRYEIRLNDRDYQVGDILHLQEWDKDKGDYTGAEAYYRVTALSMGGPGLKTGYCVLCLDGPWGCKNATASDNGRAI